MNQCSRPSWSKLNTAAMLHDVFSMTKTRYVRSMLAFLMVHLKTLNLVYRLNNMSTLKMLSFTVRVTLPSYLETIFFMDLTPKP